MRINPERDGFTLPVDAGTVWGPTNYEWRHQCLANSAGQSASDRMPNGNTFVALSDAYMYEVDEAGTVVWQYNASPQKAFRYTCDDAGHHRAVGTRPLRPWHGRGGTFRSTGRHLPEPHQRYRAACRN